MRALVRAGDRLVEARWSSAPVGCPRCESLLQQVEALREANARLRASLLDAQRAAKRQAAPFSKGAPELDPKPPGRKRGPHYGVKSRRPLPDHFDESHEAVIGSCCPDCGSKKLEETKVVDQYEEDIPPSHASADSASTSAAAWTAAGGYKGVTRCRPATPSAPPASISVRTH